MNSITVAGQLGKDAEIKYMPNGDPVASFSVADSKGKDQGAIWWNCSLFGKRAESLTPYLTKGQAVTISGTVTEREWTDKDGQKRKSMDVRVQDVALQGGKRADAPIQQQGTATRTPAPRQASGGFADMDSDVPFINPMRGSARCLAM
jgi:single-strand DNA-binding protein